MKRITVPIEIVTTDDGEKCDFICPHYHSGTCSLFQGSGQYSLDLERDTLSFGGSSHYRCRFCLAAERKAKGEGK